MLEVDRISKTFPAAGGGVDVLRQVTFAVPDGGRAAIMGPSGSGKSTLLSIIGGLEPPSAGSVRLDGVDPYAHDEVARAAFRNRQIGLVFQEHHLLAGCSALDNVVVPALATGSVPADVVARAGRLLQRVGLADRSGHRPAALSGGERQRVAVARALVLGPRLVLADEPTGQLDSKAATAVVDLLLELTAESGGMLVVVTHDDRIARRVGGMLILRDGRLEA